MLLRFHYVKLINGNTCKSKHCFVNICQILLLFCGNCHGSTVTLRVPPGSLHCAVSKFPLAPLFSFTLFSHCGLCLCLHISISLSACVHVLHFFIFGLLSSFVILDCFFCMQVSLLFVGCFCKARRLFYFISHPLLSPSHLFILLPSLLCLNIIFPIVDF